jgi:predicted GNAT family acetyltransferase
LQWKAGASTAKDAMPDDVHVSHNPAAGTFEIRSDAGTALLRYVHSGEDLDLIHTEVPSALEGQGYGAALARAALDFARRERVHVVPSCPFVASYLRRHPEDAELVAAA